MVPSNPRSHAWVPGSNLAVVVFNPTSDPEFEKIRDGAVKWNSHALTNCSGVSFGIATRAPVGEDPDGAPPNNTVWYYRAHNTQFDPEFRNIGGSQVWEIRAAKVRIQNPWGSSINHLEKIATHELGHGFGLRNEVVPGVADRSIMGIATQITQCDIEAIRKVYCPELEPTPTPTPSPTPPESCPLWCIPPDPPPTPFSEYVDVDFCLYGISGCPPGWGRPTKDSECCWNGTPILLDIDGDGFDLTNAENGVSFDLNNDGLNENISWTRGDSDDAWLALDRDGNGTIDNGHELFGNFTPQSDPPPGEVQNGFLALAVYDRVAHGGNGDGMISRLDSIFPTLRLWRDFNHNGLSEPGELSTLDELGIVRIEVSYKFSRKVDEHGNKFRYRAKVMDSKGFKVSRWAWDVILLGR